MARNIPVNWKILIPEPVEVKMVTQTLAERDAIDMLERFRGLFTYVVEEDTFYYLGDGIENKDWKMIGKPQAVVVLDTFSAQPQKIISGFGVKTFLEQTYYTRGEVDTLLEGIRIPGHLEGITASDVEKLRTMQGDIALRIDFPDPKITWVVPHPRDKNVTSFLPGGREILGRKVQLNPTLTSIHFNRPLSGYIIIN